MSLHIKKKVRGQLSSLQPRIYCERAQEICNKFYQCGTPAFCGYGTRLNIFFMMGAKMSAQICTARCERADQGPSCATIPALVFALRIVEKQKRETKCLKIQSFNKNIVCKQLQDSAQVTGAYRKRTKFQCKVLPGVLVLFRVLAPLSTNTAFVIL